jgi:hypothetical protein
MSKKVNNHYGRWFRQQYRPNTMTIKTQGKPKRRNRYTYFDVALKGQGGNDYDAQR